LLLPQVAVDEGFDAEEFLNQCCLKAGLMPDAWVIGGVKVARFQGQIFSEERPGGRVFERMLNVAGRKG
jgi:AMMECR1 domain-containing protein